MKYTLMIIFYLISFSAFSEVVEKIPAKDPNDFYEIRTQIDHFYDVECIEEINISETLWGPAAYYSVWGKDIKIIVRNLDGSIDEGKIEVAYYDKSSDSLLSKTATGVRVGLMVASLGITEIGFDYASYSYYGHKINKQVNRVLSNLEYPKCIDK